VLYSSFFFGHRPKFFNDRKNLSQSGHTVWKYRLVNTVAASFNAIMGQMTEMSQRNKKQLGFDITQRLLLREPPYLTSFEEAQLYFLQMRCPTYCFSHLTLFRSRVSTMRVNNQVLFRNSIERNSSEKQVPVLARWRLMLRFRFISFSWRWSLGTTPWPPAMLAKYWSSRERTAVWFSPRKQPTKVVWRHNNRCCCFRLNSRVSSQKVNFVSKTQTRSHGGIRGKCPPNFIAGYPEIYN